MHPHNNLVSKKYVTNTSSFNVLQQAANISMQPIAQYGVVNAPPILEAKTHIKNRLFA
jgi:hypothetical protein